jgi:DNA-binding CsgD family transcriptional regulator
MNKIIDIAGLKYGDYTVLKYLGDEKWELCCKCGTTVSVDGQNIRRGIARKKCIHYNKPPYLTQRESDIARLIVDNLNNNQIAKTLGISVDTVRVCILNMRRKFNIYNKKELAVAGLASSMPESAKGGEK